MLPLAVHKVLNFGTKIIGEIALNKLTFHYFFFFFFASIIGFTRQQKICHVAEKYEFLTFREVNFHFLDGDTEEIGVKRLRQR